MTHISKATLHTTMGDIVISLFGDQVPTIVDNFAGLAAGTAAYTETNPSGTLVGPFYDGCHFHMVARDIVIQTGDPTGMGKGGPGYWLDDEIVEGLNFDRPYLVGTAGKGAMSHGSQFFITLQPMEHLNGGYTIFGELADDDSKQVAHAISQTPHFSMYPVDPVTITSISTE